MLFQAKEEEQGDRRGKETGARTNGDRSSGAMSFRRVLLSVLKKKKRSSCWSSRRLVITPQQQTRSFVGILLLLLIIAEAAAVLASPESDAAMRSGNVAGAASTTTTTKATSTKSIRTLPKERRTRTRPRRRRLLAAAEKRRNRRQRRNKFTRKGSYTLLSTVPHDSNAFTQGLVIVKNKSSGKLVVYEGTGLYGGRSTLRQVNLSSGKVIRQINLDGKYFGEGIAYFETPPSSSSSSGGGGGGGHPRIIQITWKERTGFIYDASNFQLLQTFSFTTSNNQGWGITYKAKTHEFYVTDGSANLMVWDASTLKEKRSHRVAVKRRTTRRGGGGGGGGRSTVLIPVSRLNEIEYDPSTNTVLANVWQKNIIVRIDPSNGFVTKIYNLSGLVGRHPTADVLNGIALAAGSNKNSQQQVWVTGKYWPNMYKIQLN